MVDRNPARNLKFEVAFTTDPDDPAPVWVDLTSRLDLAAGITIRRGREDEYSQVQTGVMQLTLNNTDGALTPDNASSPYYPNVLPQRRCRLKYVNPDTAAVTYRFDGHVDEWPVEWPGGSQNYSQSTITATDMLARLGARQKLRSVVVETLALDEPDVHFPLGEPADSTTVASVAGEAAVLTLTQLGSGGTLEFAQGTGVPTDGENAPTWASASLTNGKYLTGPIPPIGVPGRTAGTGVTLEAAIASTSVLGEAAVELSDSVGNRLQIGYNAAGEPFAVYRPYDTFIVGGSWSAVDTAHTYNDGQTHTLAVTLTGNGSDSTIRLYVDGVFADSDTFTSPMTTFDRLTIGGVHGSSAFYAGTISHVAAWGTPLSAAQLLEHHESMTTGFAGERSDQRIARACSWAGLPTARQALDVGNSTSVGHIDTTGLGVLEYMRKIEVTEAGLLFAGVDGKLTFHNRARSYASTAPALSVPSRLLDASTRLAKNLLLVVNDVTGSRQGGATVRMTDQASIDDYFPLPEDLDIVATSDADVTDAVAWRLNTSKTPLTRFTQMDLDAHTDPTYSPQVLTAVNIGARVEITGMPSQSPSSTQRQTVQGYAETVTADRWSLSVNATPYAHMIALILDDTTYGVLDANPLAY